MGKLVARILMEDVLPGHKLAVFQLVVSPVKLGGEFNVATVELPAVAVVEHPLSDMDVTVTVVEPALVRVVVAKTLLLLELTVIILLNDPVLAPLNV